MAEVAAPVVRELRLALLAPAELSALEEQNQREPLIPVRTLGTKRRSTQQPGWGGGGGGEWEEKSGGWGGLQPPRVCGAKGYCRTP